MLSSIMLNDKKQANATWKMCGHSFNKRHVKNSRDMTEIHSLALVTVSSVFKKKVGFFFDHFMVSPIE